MEPNCPPRYGASGLDPKSEEAHEERIRVLESSSTAASRPPAPPPQVLWQDLPPISKPHETPEDTHRGAAIQVGAGSPVSGETGRVGWEPAALCRVAPWPPS